MITRENFSEKHIRKLQGENHRDPLLLERTLFAFGLLEALVQESHRPVQPSGAAPFFLNICLKI
jgi:hypothetical protein